MKVLVPSSDHSYYEAYVSEEKVVYNTQTKEYYEYAGDDYLEDGDTVIVRNVVR